MIDIEKYKDYVQSESPNKSRISAIVNNIKGNRTAAVYASDIGLNAARISRIINGVYSNALDFDTLVKLADGDENNLERLLYANGTLSPKDLEEKNLRSGLLERRIERQKREDTINAIIVTEILSRGLGVERNFVEHSFNADSSVLTRILSDFEYKVTDKTDLLINWKFEICDFTGLRSEQDEERFVRLDLRRFFAQRYTIFLADAWEPETLEGCKFSFVFTNELIMTAFEKQIRSEKLNNSFSLILIDMDQSKVVKEVVLSGKNDMHVFEMDKINVEQSDHYDFDFDGNDMDM